RQGFRDWLEAWEGIEYRADELIDLGDNVLAMVSVSARGRTSGIEVEYETPQLWTIREGKVVRMRVFDDREEAMKVAGPSMRIEEAPAVPPDLAAAIGRLVGQLSSSASPPTVEELRGLVDSPAARLLVAYNEDGDIIGSLTLALFRIPTGMRAWIE